ncbi:mandelate racemase/muconate lactonizing enzyme family protein [Roseinatronobacter monicus]|uniref:L-alanine-DL-glutamate epimerase-like enolase superfamily enzyme n=1 Tax=Roseinatronobacter monicus TaxID=393481 RepID=A0A543KAU9_9RHOB|nr:mandelate racemase/muconate lactonizing enzyme family protein [Roseinatronobacter monicus]TQM92205.1 L-alanine-DL-glutamate epimerase-like enolase superfamily enzyme [Roseinatronobacter monicus]
MRIVEIRENVASISSNISNAYIDFSRMTCSVVAIITDVIRDGKPVVGYGYHSNGRYDVQGILRNRILPRLTDADPDSLLDDTGNNLDPFRIWDVMMKNEKPGGHGERPVAVGAVDMAVWDAVAKIADVPLWKLLADRYRGGVADDKVWLYAAGGYYYPGKDHRALQAEMQSYLDRGYRVVKMKIGGASLDEDQRRIEAALEVVGHGRNLCVDANGRFDLDTAIRYAEALAPYNLFWYEEAGDPLDYALQAELANHYDHAMATGENLFSHQDARNLLRHGGMRPDRDWLQFDCSLSYGLVEYLRTLDVMAEMGWSSRRVVPHGGHQLSLNMAAGLHLGGNESYPDVFRPYNGFADDIPVEDGHVRLPDSPGIGFERRAELLADMKRLLD